jgi:HEAT repeat protein
MANDRVEKQLESLKALRSMGLNAEVTAALKKALADKVNVVVAKAAQICGQMQVSALLPDLKKAFERLFEKDKDPQCWGKNALAKALKDLGLQESALFVRGVRHVQMEPVWGGRQDAAAVLRGACAMALVQCNDVPRDETLRYLVDALSDESATVRLDAARALEQMGGREVVLVLRLKARVGDEDPRVTGQVLEMLLAMEGAGIVPFVGAFLDAANEEVSEEAALALGASRLVEAIDLLKEKWKIRERHQPGGMLLRAISISRLDEAIEFLLELVKSGQRQDAQDAVLALELHKGAAEMVMRIEQALAERGDSTLGPLVG